MVRHIPRPPRVGLRPGVGLRHGRRCLRGQWRRQRRLRRRDQRRPDHGAVRHLARASLAGSNVGTAFLGHGNKRDEWGWVLGGGVEWAFTNNLTFKVEGLWVGFDGGNGVFNDSVVGVTNTGAPIHANGVIGLGGNNDNGDVFIARVGLNYKFGL